MRLSVLKTLLSALICSLGFTINGADTNPPVVVTAGSFDGQTIGVCFSEALDAASATNVANYRISGSAYAFPISDTNFPVVEATLRPNQNSVILKLSQPYPADSFAVSSKSVKDLSGNSQPTGFITRAQDFAASDVGIAGVDPREPGSVFYCGQLFFDDIEHGFEVMAGGSGLEGTNDSFHFIYEKPRAAAGLIRARVTSLEAANRFSSAGLMVRDDLSPGSRFFSVTVTPPDVPARDGSGNGANTVQVRYRDVAGGQAAELAVTNLLTGLPYPDVWLELLLSGRTCSASIMTNQQNWVQLGEFTFTDPFPNQVLAGIATFSHNNNAGFTTKATYANAGLLKGDVFQGPRLTAGNSATNLVLKWTEPFEFPYFLLSAPEPSTAIFWDPVTNQVSYQFTSSNVQAAVTVPIASSSRFFGLRLSRW